MTVRIEESETAFQKEWLSVPDVESVLDYKSDEELLECIYGGGKETTTEKTVQSTSAVNGISEEESTDVQFYDDDAEDDNETTRDESEVMDSVNESNDSSEDEGEDDESADWLKNLPENEEEIEEFFLDYDRESLVSFIEENGIPLRIRKNARITTIRRELIQFAIEQKMEKKPIEEDSDINEPDSKSEPKPDSEDFGMGLFDSESDDDKNPKDDDLNYVEILSDDDENPSIPTAKKDDTIEWEYKNKTRTGLVTKVFNSGAVYVIPTGGGNLTKVDYGEYVVLKKKPVKKQKPQR